MLGSQEHRGPTQVTLSMSDYMEQGGICTVPVLSLTASQNGAKILELASPGFYAAFLTIQMGK